MAESTGGYGALSQLAFRSAFGLPVLRDPRRQLCGKRHRECELPDLLASPLQWV